MIAGINVGGTTCSALAADEHGKITERFAWPSAALRGPGPMIEEIVRAIRSLMAAHADIDRIGVAIGGPMTAPDGLIESPPHLPGWTNIELGKILRETFPVPVRVEHDAAACAYAEFLWGNFAGAHSLIYLTCGTGSGAGIVIGGKVIRGTAGLSCEIGHQRLFPGGPTAFGKAGSVESFCAASSIPLLAAWRFPYRWGEKLPEPSEITSLAVSGDQDAMVVMQANAAGVGIVCANLGDLLIPDAILLGSLARYIGDPWLAMVGETFRREAHPRVLECTSVLPATLGETVQDLSGIAAALTPD